jgi:hypothetical protein
MPFRQYTAVGLDMGDGWENNKAFIGIHTAQTGHFGQTPQVVHQNLAGVGNAFAGEWWSNRATSSKIVVHFDGQKYS